MFSFIWTGATFGMKNSGGISIESLPLQTEHQLPPMGKIKRDFSNNIKRYIFACRDCSPFPFNHLASNIWGEMDIEWASTEMVFTLYSVWA